MLLRVTNYKTKKSHYLNAWVNIKILSAIIEATTQLTNFYPKALSGMTKLDGR